MKESTIDLLAPLLDMLRGQPALQEVRPAAFHLYGRDFIHFHEEPEGIFADVRLTSGRVRMPVSSPAEQAELLERIDQTLESLNNRRSR